MKNNVHNNVYQGIFFCYSKMDSKSQKNIIHYCCNLFEVESYVYCTIGVTLIVYNLRVVRLIFTPASYMPAGKKKKKYIYIYIYIYIELYSYLFT